MSRYPDGYACEASWCTIAVWRAGSPYLGAVASRPAAGLNEGFEAFFRRLYPSAQVVGLRLTGSVRSAEAVAIEAFTDALVRWRRVSRLPHRDAWVLRRVVDDALERARHDPPAVRAEDDEPEVRRALVGALAQLPKRQRDVLVLHHLARLPLPQVAGALGVSPDHARAELHEGVEGLRALLDGPGAPR